MSGVDDTSGALKHALATPIIHRLRERLNASHPTDAPVAGGVRLAAVMALVRMTGAPVRAELLFIKRAAAQGDPWSGHIAFPGGRHDFADATLADTAIRETREELSIDVLRDGKMLGRLDDLAPVSPRLPRIIVRPFVGLVRADVTITPNREVADTFWAPVEVLKSAAAKAEHVMTVDGETLRFPAFGVGDHVVWGMTERMLTQLLPFFD